MKFTNGYWLKKDGWNVQHPREIQSIVPVGNGVRVFAPTRHIAFKGAELDGSQLTITLEPAGEGILRVRLEHFRGYCELAPNFALAPLEGDGTVAIDSAKKSAVVTSGLLRAEIGGEDHFELRFYDGDREITSSILKSMGIAISPEGEKFIHEQLVIQPGESIFGLGEHFGPVVKNGQVVDMWNADGGTASEQAYKNVPFYFSDRGYGVFVNHPEKVSYEIGSEVNTRVQFSVPGNVLEYFVIAGPTPKDVLRRYTSMTGRAPQVPAWSYGLWLSTSFKTDYSEETVNGLLDQMEERGIPMSVLHFDCYWMRPSHWCDFVWDPELFTHPEEMLTRYHNRGIKICVWINPYIAQQSHLFEEGKEHGYLLHALDGSVRQWDHWQSGMGWVDFTNPEATIWYKNELKKLLRQGVDCFKTDFGERVPTDVIWFDGSDPQRMHNYYTYLYNQAVYEAIAEERGEEEAIVFARSGTAGSQSFPVHWGGDSEPTFVSMGETLRGGLSLGMSGFGYWSHDMGGFEGKPDPKVFIRWFPFGMLSSHSRLHGSDSYRTPWIYGNEAVRTAQRFVALKNRLMPYVLQVAREVTSDGIPVMRHMILEHSKDRTSAHVDTQYYFGSKMIVAPVFSQSDEVEYYLPTDGWTNLLDGSRRERAGWYSETHALDSLPIMIPDGTVLPLGEHSEQTVYNWADNVCLYLFGLVPGEQTVTVPSLESDVTFNVTVTESKVTITSDSGFPWSVQVVAPLKSIEIATGSQEPMNFTDLASGERIIADANAVEFTYSLIAAK